MPLLLISHVGASLQCLQCQPQLVNLITRSTIGCFLFNLLHTQDDLSNCLSHRGLSLRLHSLLSALRLLLDCHHSRIRRGRQWFIVEQPFSVDAGDTVNPFERGLSVNELRILACRTLDDLRLGCTVQRCWIIWIRHWDNIVIIERPKKLLLFPLQRRFLVTAPECFWILTKPLLQQHKFLSLSCMQSLVS